MLGELTVGERLHVNSCAHERIDKLHWSCRAEIPIFFPSAQHFLSVNENRKQSSVYIMDQFFYHNNEIWNMMEYETCPCTLQ